MGYACYYLSVVEPTIHSLSSHPGLSYICASFSISWCVGKGQTKNSIGGDKPVSVLSDCSIVISAAIKVFSDVFE